MNACNCTCGCLFCDHEAIARQDRELDELLSRMPPLDFDATPSPSEADFDELMKAAWTAPAELGDEWDWRKK